jgi:uncharacterized membrane protein
MVSLLVWKPIICMMLIHFTLFSLHFTVPLSTAAVMVALSYKEPASARNLEFALFQRILKVL